MGDLKNIKFGKDFIGESKEAFKAKLQKRYKNVPVGASKKKVRVQLSDKEIDQIVAEHYPEPKKEGDAKPVASKTEPGTPGK